MTKMIAFDNNAVADVLEFMLAFYYCSVSVLEARPTGTACMEHVHYKILFYRKQ